jgi:bifunctional non-homologous end joining protein LigD
MGAPPLRPTGSRRAVAASQCQVLDVDRAALARHYRQPPSSESAPATGRVVGGDRDTVPIVREHELISEQTVGVGPGEPPVPSELRRGNRVVRLSNLDKPYWPDERITKGDLLRYYRVVAGAILPHIRDRPFTMKRYPDGWQGKPFFRKDVTNYAPPWVTRAVVSVTSREQPHQRRTIEVPVVNDELALLWMVNTGCIEVHTWYSRIDKLERPDRVVFDLDPSDGVGFAETAHVALLVKQALDALGLASFPKTSGARGLHVLVPIERRHTYEETRRFATEVARAIAATHPDLATVQWSKAKRRGVLIDASQNAQGKSLAAVYSVRPMPGATVSAPLYWDEVNESLDPSIYTMAAVLDRLYRRGDVHAGVLKTNQRLGPALRSLEG